MRPRVPAAFSLSEGDVLANYHQQPEEGRAANLAGCDSGGWHYIPGAHSTKNNYPNLFAHLS
ncbi:MAG: hypothetical protein ONB11_08220 [candidate division KSB1 bacterium]|nr:hypothetical protein [candidate division KSB1 bacterium]MDZ7341264.1 hypothetical protein [candidate division KSB1 bacterium]